jgi:hypothetical protein
MDGLAMNVTDRPCAAAISFTPCLKITCRSAIRDRLGVGEVDLVLARGPIRPLLDSTGTRAHPSGCELARNKDSSCAGCRVW